MSKSAWAVLTVVILALLGYLVYNWVASDEIQLKDEMIFGKPIVDKVEVVMLETFPLMADAVVSGSLQDGCTEINTAESKKEGDNFVIDITTKRPKDALCTQALVPFKKNVRLDIYGLKAGKYTVTVKGADKDVKTEFTLSVNNIEDTGK